ncbi:MAG TPA: hypothetical protein VF830_13095 [Gemmatimonadales bacterium]
MTGEDDEPLDPELRDAARAYHEPPAVPREALWTRIQLRRAAEPSAAPADPPAAREATRSPRFLVWGAGIAALLALGVGIGRLSVHVRPPLRADSTPVAAAPAPLPQAPSPAAAAPARDDAAYRLAAAEHLGQAEAFLTLFRASVREGHRERLAPAAARQLLATNRLLLDSPAAADPRLRFLLQDLELVLAEIAQLAPERRHEDLKLITDGLERDGMLVRLRAAVPAGTGAVLRRGVL